MSDRENFLAAIKATPNDDVPRLIFADWLDDNGTSDLDTATAEFIRISCTMDGKKVSSIRAGNWLDGLPGGWMKSGWNRDRDADCSGARRLMPTLFEWVDGVDRGRERLNTANELRWAGYPVVKVQRNGRLVEMRHARSPMWVPELVQLEMWRGFLRKAKFRYWSDAVAGLAKLMPDQPLVEPELRRALWPAQVNKYEAWIYSPMVGPTVEAILVSDRIPINYKPQRISVIHRLGQGYRIFSWQGPGHVERARWAVCIAFRLAAQDVIDGRAELPPSTSPNAPAEFARPAARESAPRTEPAP